ncbi:restriction endonuclease subunit S [Streptococcus sp. FT1-55]|uniref:restriction endonuclease subunit S n=1 Tax=Streptococcus sp. FT1-55 TaxID=3409805 RepID=UPI003BF56A23
MKISNIPLYRFIGYTDAWELRKLGEVADFSIKNNSLSRDKLTTDFYDVQNIHYGDILIKFNDVLDVSKTVLPSIIDSNVLDFKDALLLEGDIVFADAAEDTTVGKAVEIRNLNGKDVVSGLHTIVARPKNSFAPFYIGYFINSPAYHNQILPLMQGTKVSSISKSNLQSTYLSYPSNDEQSAIGTFFSTLDQHITLHQRKLDTLKEQKKTYLKLLFPAKGQTKPAYRFQGYTDAWELRKLGDEVYFYNGRAYKQSELLDFGKYKVVRVGNFNTNEKWYYSNLELEDSKTIDTGDLIYLWATSFGPEIWKGSKSIYHYHIWKLIIQQVEKIDKNYLYMWLYQDKKKIAQNTNGSTMVHITKKMIESRDFMFPTLPEQSAIGTFFQILDQEISQVEDKLASLKEMKKTLLRKLFVS